MTSGQPSAPPLVRVLTPEKNSVFMGAHSTKRTTSDTLKYAFEKPWWVLENVQIPKLKA